MKTHDFNFHLPSELIARYPLAERSASRLLCLDGSTGALTHRHFTDLLSLLNPEDLLVFNNTRVMAARLFAQKTSGGKVEILLERLLDTHTALAHCRASKSPKPGAWLCIGDNCQVQMQERQDEWFVLHSDKPWLDVMAEHGHMPLPPYMERDDENSDQDRYQTVYGSVPGAVAAPTAGLHFDQALLRALADKGIASAEVTLHVGAGTFQPVRVDDIQQHVMHSEWLSVSAETVKAVEATRARGGRVVAVGTTSVRALESAAQGGQLSAFEGYTRIFIYPGYRFRVVDALITNFHLPQSTLLMLVSAFSGREPILAAYKEAVAQGYRFFSYGDAMFLTPEHKHEV